MYLIMKLHIDRGIKSNFVVRLIGVVNNYPPIYVVMELMERGDLKSFLIKEAALSDEVSHELTDYIIIRINKSMFI